MVKRKFHPSGQVLLVLLLIIFNASFLSGQIVRDTVSTEFLSDSLIQSNKVELLFGQDSRNRSLQSILTVYTDQLITTPGPQFLQVLAGRVPGLNIWFTNGGPGIDGNGMGFNIRGARAQVILIDGVERGYLSIDPEQIESISVLKDALSTVMFGHRSSYGIISIKSKKGDLGKPRISFTAQSGIETPLALPKPLPAWQQATLYNEARQNDAGLTKVDPLYTDAQIEAYRNQTDPYLFPDVDWYATALNKNAGIRRYNFNIQGSGRGFRYFVDLDNLKEKGLFKTDDANKYNTNSQLDRYLFRSNVGVDVTPTTFVQLNLVGRFQRYNQPGGTVGTLMSSLLTTPSYAYPIYNENGTYGGTNIYGQNANIYGQLVGRGYQFTDVRDIAVDLEVNQKLDFITKGLSFKARGSNNNTAYYTTNRSKNFAAYQYVNGSYVQYGNSTEQTTTGSANDRFRIVYLEGSLAYERSFGRHGVNVLMLANQQSRLSFNNANLPENYTAFAGRANYAYNDTYILEGAFSYAGYNWLAPEKRWAPYWAAGAGWNLHNEKFMREHVPGISYFKLRGNYGLTGQVNAGYYSYIQTYYNVAPAYWFGSGSSLQRSTGENTLVNTSLSPEKAKKLDLGLDLGFWKDKLTLSADYFFNRFFDVVAAQNMTTAILGSVYPVQNYQKLNYWGSELGITWRDNLKSFSYFLKTNLSLIRSEVVYNAELPRAYDYQVGTGKPVGIQYGYIATGLFKSYEEINDPSTAVLPAAPKSSLRPGDIRYLDRNDDGIIDVNDQGPIGTLKPFVYYGFNVGFSYKGFDFSALIQGTMNRQSYISGDFMNGFGNNGNSAAYEYNLGRFTEQTAAIATQPRVWLGANVNNTQVSTFWLKDNDFVRLKNAELGYTFPSTLTKRIGIPVVRIFSNGLNLLTFADIYKMRKDMDPETWGASYPLTRIVNFGINVKF